MIDLLVIIVLYVLMNLVSFASYGWDKRKAVKGQWRTKESTLLIMGLLGPWGAIAGMSKFRHKTQKNKFKLNYLFLIIHIAIFAYVMYTYA